MNHNKDRKYTSKYCSPIRSKRHDREEKYKSKTRRRIASTEDGQRDDHELHYRGETRNLKELAKALETPEEKRLRRLAKKEEKDRKQKGKMGWDDEDLGYTNSNNPFGDHNLRETFIWHKKNEKTGITDAEALKLKQRQKQEDTRVELQKVKQRRLERERERSAREEEMTMMQREKEAAMFEEWEKQEDDFHLQQARKRSKIRIKDGRAKPIDMLAEYVNPEEEDFQLQIDEPYSVLIGLSMEDIEDLIEDVKVYMQLEQGQNAEFWKDMTIVAKGELEKLKAQKNEDMLRNNREVIHSSVKTDVASVFNGKTHNQLLVLEKQIKQKVKEGGAIDIGYWESILKQLKAQIAKARLKDRHQHMLRQKLSELKYQEAEDSGDDSESQVEMEGANEPNDNARPGPSDDVSVVPVESDAERHEETNEKQNEKEYGNAGSVNSQPAVTEEGLAMEAYHVYSESGYSPRLIPFQDVEEAKWTTSDADIQRLGYLRMQVKAGSTVEEEEEADRSYATEASRVLGDAEEAFNVPVSLNEKIYSWTDKYRPRKPRFFNRVHTGYEWNKYNQTHYDSDNPPPKIVQGYKFNIFYPDLIDKTKTPEYILTPCKDNPDFAILKFSGGAPYEDIAFKVVNREWELAHKHGFRCQFQNNVFQLWFHFKRYRYRR